ncbi:MAG: GNAT family N-acetyltransferase [candidate division Zixibacteria bacterium]|nr:GNAT family N-acetyltransferase [candidate division Zixibacteria bacterium]
MEFQPLTIKHLESRLKKDLEVDPSWFVPHIQNFISYNPKGCFALVNRDKTLGIVTTTLYDNIGWIGWLYVDDSFRHQGLGERLMRKAIEYINKNKIYSVVIEAVREAATLYQRIGFESQFETHHFKLYPDKIKPNQNNNFQILPISSIPREKLADFDFKYFHQNRHELFKIIVNNPKFSGYIALENKKIIGYIFVTEDSKSLQVSPLVINLNHPHKYELTNSLLRVACNDKEKPLYLRCPSLRKQYFDFLTSIGAEPTGYFTYRMFLGKQYEIESEGVLSLGCPGKG